MTATADFTCCSILKQAIAAVWWLNEFLKSRVNCIFLVEAQTSNAFSDLILLFS